MFKRESPSAGILLVNVLRLFAVGCDDMKDPYKRRYIYLMLAISGAISLSIAFFFVLYRFQGIGDAVDEVVDILAPFVYGGVVAYLLRPMCNFYEKCFQNLFPKGLKKAAPAVAVALSLATGIFIVYLLLIMILPQLYHSIRSLWNTLPEKVEQFLNWAIVTFGENEEMLTFFDTSFDKIYAELESWVQSTLMPYVTNIVSEVGSSVWKVLMFLYNLLIGIIVAVYLLGSRKKFARQGVLLVRSTLKPKWADLVLEEIAFVDRMFGGFIDGKLVDTGIKEQVLSGSSGRNITQGLSPAELKS